MERERWCKGQLKRGLAVRSKDGNGLEGWENGLNRLRHMMICKFMHALLLSDWPVVRQNLRSCANLWSKWQQQKSRERFSTGAIRGRCERDGIVDASAASVEGCNYLSISGPNSVPLRWVGEMPGLLFLFSRRVSSAKYSTSTRVSTYISKTQSSVTCLL